MSNCIDLISKLGATDRVGCFSISTVAEENGKRFAFNNTSNKTICKAKVDNCLITDQTVKKCDFLFNIQEDGKYYLVELKGQSIDVALKQIERTYDIVNKNIKTTPDKYTGIIVSSAVPKAANLKYANLQEKLYRDKKLLVKRKSVVYEERV
ncbi:hypothetical protein HDC92_000594 [Pedobacter sp. AK017]|uniref:hypothetical protein n=1 Tax=Pedobacter sp. AK017 TaxID=2723073 RepID=UPI0016072DAE|nr:hypothetical protein [Pedobacter sp. AK017]MBB5436930.1 hypothetical protein [Pedobacter sp. AK017]